MLALRASVEARQIAAFLLRGKLHILIANPPVTVLGKALSQLTKLFFS